MTICILSSVHGESPEDLIYEAALSFQRRKKKRHELWILSCYINLGLVEEYVNRLLKAVRLTNVYLAFNFSEIYKIGPGDSEDKLKSIKGNLKKKHINFEWDALASSSLMHGKGYALIQRTDGEISDGVVLTTSANFTNSGFKGKNIELGYMSTKKKDIQNFTEKYGYLRKEFGAKIALREIALRENEYLLKFVLLSSGRFLHKWSGSLSQQVGIKYKLTAKAKKKSTIAPELEKAGFKKEGDTLTRQVLKLDDLQRKVPSQFIKRFTIETYWGRWCPSDAWSTLNESPSAGSASQFIRQFKKMTKKSKLENIKEEALDTQRNLIKGDLLEEVAEDHIENWAARIQKLRSNQQRLERFYTGYDAHELPYQIGQKSEVCELFDNLMEAIQQFSEKKNTAKTKFYNAYEKADPKLIALTENEKEMISDYGDK